jgi:hypothetical protein
MGHATGAAAAIVAAEAMRDVRDLDVVALRARLAEGGAVLDGVH